MLYKIARSVWGGGGGFDHAWRNAVIDNYLHLEVEDELDRNGRESMADTDKGTLDHECFLPIELTCDGCGRRFRPSYGLLIQNLDNLIGPVESDRGKVMASSHDDLGLTIRDAAHADNCRRCATGAPDRPGEIVADNRVITLHAIEEILRRETSIIGGDGDVEVLMELMRAKATAAPVHPPKPEPASQHDDIPF